MQSGTNLAVIASAGARKTQQIIDAALANDSEPVLITTYTNENKQQIIRRIEDQVGVVPKNVSITGWFTFLVNQCARPYQRTLTNEPGKIRSLNFKGAANMYTKRDNIGAYYFDSNEDMYRNGVSDFVCRLDQDTGGKVVGRLERIFRHILIDEVQDLVGYDLDVLDLLMASSMNITMVGDPRQHTLSTNTGMKNKKYRGPGFVDWLNERSAICTIEHRNGSYRCNKSICDFANGLFPDMEPMSAVEREAAAHEGIHTIHAKDVPDYHSTHSPVVLRDSKKFETMGLPAMNIGVAKGSTFDHVLLFPTKPMIQYLQDGDPSKLKAPERLYVAVTRARHSVAFVVD